MSTETRAAVLEAPEAPLRLLDLELDRPAAGEVLVEMSATGVCHSDLSILDATLPAPLPLVLGHEGAGFVAELGEGVTELAVGDQVVLSWLAPCRVCFYCVHGQPYLCRRAQRLLSEHTLPDGSTRLRRDGAGVRQFCGLGTFARRCVVAQECAIPVPATVPPPAAAVIGCAVLTGFGAAVNTAAVGVGESVAVLGCGGVGLSAIQGARIAGATRIVAIDVQPERLELAARLGATDTVLAGPEARRQVRGLTGGRGADVVLEFAGTERTLAEALALARPGGRVVFVSAPAPDVALHVPAFTGVVLPGKTVQGCIYGSTDVRRDIPRLVELYESGALRLDELVTETFGFADIEDAVRYCADRRGGRAVVRFEQG